MAMVYDITDKLKFGEDPVLKIKDEELTVHSGADVLLQVIDLYRNKGEIDATIGAIDLLLSEEDRKKLEGIGLQMVDYMTVVKTMVSLALGEDPEEDDEKN